MGLMKISVAAKTMTLMGSLTSDCRVLTTLHSMSARSPDMRLMMSPLRLPAKKEMGRMVILW